MEINDKVLASDPTLLGTGFIGEQSNVTICTQASNDLNAKDLKSPGSNIDLSLQSSEPPLKPQKWIPRSKLVRDAKLLSAEEKLKLSKETTIGKIRSSLNKLTLETFNKIAKDLIDILKGSVLEDDAYTLKRIFDITLEKACDEPFFSGLYAKFTLCLIQRTPGTVVDKTAFSKDNTQLHGKELARRVLIGTANQNIKR